MILKKARRIIKKSNKHVQNKRSERKMQKKIKSLYVNTFLLIYVLFLISPMQIIEGETSSIILPTFYKDTTGFSRGVFVHGNYAFVADGESGLAIIDISDPTHAGEPIYRDTNGHAFDVFVYSNYAYVADFYGLAIIDITNPTNPGQPIYRATSGYARSVFVARDFAFVAIAEERNGLAIIDISDPVNPGQPTYRDTIDEAHGVYISGNYAFLAVWEAGMAIIDVTDPTNPGQPDYISIDDHITHKIFIEDDYAFLVEELGLIIIDIRDPSNPGDPIELYFDVESYDIGSVFVINNYAYLPIHAADLTSLGIIDFGNPRIPGEPVYVSLIGEPWDVYVVGNYAFVADGDSGLAIIDISSLSPPPPPARIHINGNADWEYVAATYPWCTGAGTPQNPYIIQGLTIDGGGSGSGILIENSDVYFIIEHCTIYNTGSQPGDAAIRLQSTKNGQLADNDCSHNNFGGIAVIYGENNKVLRNTANENGVSGIVVTFSVDNIISDNIVSKNYGWGMFVYESDRITITGNTVNENSQVGILVESDTDTTDFNVIKDNIVSYNGWNGIYLERGKYCIISGNTLEHNNHGAIRVSLSHQNEISENAIKKNPLGISLGIGCFDNFINNNTIEQNSYGVYLFNTFDNHIFLNNLNDNAIANAWSVDSINNWNSPKLITYTYCGDTYKSYLGNYWDDYTGADTDEDGIGDTPYAIDADVDNYPLMQPFENYFPPEIVFQPPYSYPPMTWGWSESLLMGDAFYYSMVDPIVGEGEIRVGAMVPPPGGDGKALSSFTLGDYWENDWSGTAIIAATFNLTGFIDWVSVSLPPLLPSGSAFLGISLKTSLWVYDWSDSTEIWRKDLFIYDHEPEWKIIEVPEAETVSYRDTQYLIQGFVELNKDHTYSWYFEARLWTWVIAAGFATAFAGGRITSELIDVRVSPPILRPEPEPATHIENPMYVAIGSPVDALVTDPEGRRVGFDFTTQQEINEIPGAWYSDHVTSPQLIRIPAPLSGNYEVLLFGTGTDSYTAFVFGTIDLVGSQVFSGYITDDAIYAYTVTVEETRIEAKPNPACELEHFKDNILELSPEIFTSNADNKKKVLSNKIDEVIQSVEVGSYAEAVNKLLHDIRAKMDGDSTAQDWIKDPAAQFKLCVIIDHVIEGIRKLQ